MATKDFLATEVTESRWRVVGGRWWVFRDKLNSLATYHQPPTTHRHETHETGAHPARRQSVCARRARGVDGATRSQYRLGAAPGGLARHGDWEDWKRLDGAVGVIGGQ